MKPIQETLKSNPLLYERFRKSFRDQAQKILDHPEVKRLQEQTGIPENLILSSLPEIRHWLLEKAHCGQCPGLEQCPNMFQGYYPTPHVENGKLYFDWQACSLMRRHRKEQQQKRLLRSHLIPKEALHVTFKDLETDEGNAQAVQAAVLFCRQFPDTKGKGLYFYGEFGVGKTFLMGAIANKLTEQGWSVYFVHVPAFLREMKQSLNDHSLLEKLRELENVDCLILDDIGSENLTPWLRDEILGPLIQYRTQHRKPILYTSNLSYDQLQEHLAQTSRGEVDLMKSLRIMERIRAYTDAYFLYGKNRRRMG